MIMCSQLRLLNIVSVQAIIDIGALIMCILLLYCVINITSASVNTQDVFFVSTDLVFIL